MSIGAHHQNLREREKTTKYSYPHKNIKIKFLDNVVTFISFVFPLSALPQIYNIWILRDVQGVSFLTWMLFFIMQIPLFIYAIVHKENRLKIMFGLWCAVYLIVLLGLIIYQ